MIHTKEGTSNALQLLVADLLGAWDGVPNDEKRGMTPWLDRVADKIEAIEQLVDEPYPCDDAPRSSTERRE